MSITENKERIGSFTSSEIFRLTKVGTKEMNAEELIQHKIDFPKSRKKMKPFGFSETGLTYIEEKGIEKRMNRSIRVEAHSQAMAWGSFMEMYVFGLIGMEYEITSEKTDVHPKIKGWSGSKDLIVQDVKVSDIKCYQPLAFARYTDALLKKDVSFIKENFVKEYWQLVSNAVINNTPNAEAITFMPYESELESIREMAENYDGADQWKYRFITENEKAALPYLPNEGYYKNLNKFEFEVPQEDKDFLEARVVMAIDELEKQLKTY